MFTGLIEGLCTVKSASQSVDGSMRISVDLGGISKDCKTGDSIAVNGVCLTITGLRGGIAAFDISSETISKSTIGSWQAGTAVNIEKSIAADGRLGGHFVMGHIDGVAKVKKVVKKGEFIDMKFTAGKELIDSMIEKGSVAIDGISLTISELKNDSFSVALIPETLNRTTLGKAAAGDEVNIETDLIVKIIKRHLEQLMPKQGLTIEKLQELGF